VLEEEAAAGRLDSVDILSLNDSRDGVDARSGEFRTAAGSQWRFVLAALDLLLRRRPQLLIIDHLGLGRAFEIFPLSLLKPKTALFIHGTEFWAIESGSREQVVRNSDMILTNSDFTAGTVRDRMPEVASRVRAVLLCIDPTLTSRWESMGTATPGDREPAVLIVARMHDGEPGKGHETLIDAWSRVRESVPAARLWIVGDGTARPELERRAREKCAEGIDFLGKISDEDLSDRYDRASLFAMPSQQEGFGLVYAEAMWHGLPCIGSSSDAAREVIREGVTGTIVPYGDAGTLAGRIVAMLEDANGRLRMGENARIEARTRFAFPRFRADLLSALGLSRRET
jgi:phosphatidylinositol alpha-1,6-mannosyltransferase